MEAQAVLDNAAMTLLVFKTKKRLSQGEDSISLSDINEILTVANRGVIIPDSLEQKELEVI